MTDLCRKKTPSVFRECQPCKESSVHVHIYDSICILTEKLRRFNWNVVGDELETRAPILHKLLKVCVEVKRKKRPVKSSFRVGNDAAMGGCAAILLHHKNQHMNALQHIISLILHRGHARKQVKSTVSLIVLID